MAKTMSASLQNPSLQPVQPFRTLPYASGNYSLPGFRYEKTLLLTSPNVPPFPLLLKTPSFAAIPFFLSSSSLCPPATHPILHPFLLPSFCPSPKHRRRPTVSPSHCFSKLFAVLSCPKWYSCSFLEFFSLPRSWC